MTERWTGRKAKHRRDGNHGKRGLVSGNPRYNGSGPGWGNDRRPHRTRPTPGRELQDQGRDSCSWN